MLAVRVLSRTIGFKPVSQCMPSTFFVAQQCSQFSTKKIVREKTDTKFDLVPIQDIASSIDTTLTEEQKEYVAKIKKQIRGGHKSPRCKLQLKTCHFPSSIVDIFITLSTFMSVYFVYFIVCVLQRCIVRCPGQTRLSDWATSCPESLTTPRP